MHASITNGLAATSVISSLNSLSTASNTLVSSGNYILISSDPIKILTNVFQFFYTFNHSPTTESTLPSFSLQSSTVL